MVKKDKEGKLQLGIYVAAIDVAVGPMTIVVVGVDSKFLRKYSSMIKSKKDAHIKLMAKTVPRLSYIHIPIEEFKRMPILDLIPTKVIECLNSIKEFWNHEIKIELWQYDRPDYERKLLKHLPINLRKVDLKIDKWGIEANNKSKVVQLAATFANHFNALEMQDIKNVYGDFGTGEVTDKKTLDFLDKNKDCPHIRRLV